MGGGTGTGGGPEVLLNDLLEQTDSRYASVRRVANTAFVETLGVDSSFGKLPESKNLEHGKAGADQLDNLSYDEHRVLREMLQLENEVVDEKEI